MAAACAYVLYLDLVIREEAATHEEHSFMLAYADDTVQTAAAEAELEEITSRWNKVFNKCNLKLHLRKTEIMTIGRVHPNLNIKIG